MDTTALYDFTPAARLALLGLVIASAPLAWVWLRHRRDRPHARLRALTALTLFLTFDLILFGSFTRLSDSGLGCPDWPGCYGAASPIGARGEISAAQAILPDGPVTHAKAWIEMVHRYLATGVGVLITVMMLSSWWMRRQLRGLQAPSPWWPTVTWVWVCLQGAFGALTVTMKLYPAIVTLHLLGGMGLLALLAAQWHGHQPDRLARSIPMTRRVHAGVVVVAALLVMQIALGGWVSTNYAVLACRDFPTCQGQWWPPMDFAEGYTILRELGAARDGGFLPFPALTAIHVTHRLFAIPVLLGLFWLAWALWRTAEGPARAAARWHARALLGLAAWQFASGLSNVVLGWPLLAALAHVAGAAGLVVVLTGLVMRGRPVRAPQGVPGAAAYNLRPSP